MPHVIHTLYDQVMDFPPPHAEPSKRYMIATIPRTGSTFTCLQFWRTGLLGAPMEYMNLPNVEAMIRRLGDGDLLTYWRNVQRVRSSPNGVFGFKSFIANFQALLDEKHVLLPEIQSDEVIYLTRRDKFAQAVSYARAAMTKVWFSGIQLREEPQYDFEKISNAEFWIASQENSWERLFERTGVTPIRIYYEDVLEDFAPVAEALAEKLEVELDPSRRVHVPGMEKQSSQISVEWAKRYAEEREAAIAARPGLLKRLQRLAPIAV